MDQAKRDLLLTRYTQAVDAMFVALDHIPEDMLDERPEPKARSAREIIHHLAESELQESGRLRRILAENIPVLHHWNAEQYAARLHYDRPVARSMELFRAAALANVELLQCLTNDQWRRAGNIQKPWSLTIEDWLMEQVNTVHNLLMDVINAPHGGRAIPDPHDGPQLFGERKA